MRPRLLVVGPLPPPYHGVTVSTSLVLGSQVLRERFDVEHVDTSDHRREGIGTWDATNMLVASRAVKRLLARLHGRRGVVYLPLSQNVPGFLRDSLFVHAAATSGWKVAAHLRGGELHHFHARQSWAMRRWIELTLSQIETVAVMGESLRSILAPLVSDERIAVVPNGTPEPRANGVLRDPHTVLFLSNLRTRKGVIEAVEAARVVLFEEPSARFLFVGEWESDKLSRLVRQKAGDDHRIEFIPGVRDHDRDRLLASSSVLLFPPIEPEGHPRVVLEGLAAGLPIVTTDRGTIAETVIDGESGFILPEPDPTSLADRILLLLRDGDLRERMSTAARARYLERFTQEEADRRLTEWLVAVAEELRC